jgi:DNA-binding NarL/FixJ family response regulator
VWSRPVPGWSDPPPPPPSPHLVLEVDGVLADQLLRAAQAHDLPAEILACDLLTQAVEQESLRQRAETALNRLTPREREVARLVTLGYTNRRIAATLVVSPETVKTHIHHALEKLGVRSKADLRLRLTEMGVRRWPEAALEPIPTRARLPFDVDLPLR